MPVVNVHRYGSDDGSGVLKSTAYLNMTTLDLGTSGSLSFDMSAAVYNTPGTYPMIRATTVLPNTSALQTVTVTAFAASPTPLVYKGFSWAYITAVSKWELRVTLGY